MGGVQAQQPEVGSEASRVASGRPADSLVESRQQSLCSRQRFVPRHMCAALSDASSPCGHYDRLVFRCGEHRVSTFLHPFAPPALPGFFATMGALTPGRLALRPPVGYELQLGCRPGLPAFCHRIFRSFRLQPPTVAPTRIWGLRCRAYRTTSRWPPFRGRASVGLRLWGAGSPRRQAESSLRVLRTNRSPPVALHPASRRRSYFRLQSARAPWQGLSPYWFDAITGALGSAGRTVPAIRYMGKVWPASGPHSYEIVQRHVWQKSDCRGD